MGRILVTGLCTLHWGRLQYGNIGNYYIVEPLVRLLHKYFPEYEIVTTFQMDDAFIQTEKVTVLPMELYYAWRGETDVIEAHQDVETAEKYLQQQESELTPWLETIKDSEYLINVSGDMWGDNAEHVGHNRFLVDCLKMKAAQLMGCKTVLYAVTPGPFSDLNTRALAREVFSSFKKVFIREKVSEENLKKWGFGTDNVTWAPCPSYLFQKNEQYTSVWTQKIEKIHGHGRKVLGLTFGGFNMPCGPYDMWPREPEQYEVFINLAEHIISQLNADIVLFSHTNGFEQPPHFKLILGRDFVILKQFYELLLEKNSAYAKRIILINEPLLPCDMKKVIGELDMLVTGRVHASVAAASQCVPTVYMEYDQRVIYSDKMSGFSSQIGMERFVCVPGDLSKLLENVTECYENMEQIQQQLHVVIPEIQQQAEYAYEVIRTI